MNAKKKLEKTLNFIDSVQDRHYKTGLALRIILWVFAPVEMLGFTLTKRAYKRFVNQ